MDETTMLLLLGGMLLLMIVSMLIGFKLREYLRNRHMRDMSESEKKRWQQFEKYRVSKGGNWKVAALIIGILILFMAAAVILGSARKGFLLLAILVIPLLLVHAGFVFKTKNRDQIISLIFSLLLCAGYGLYGVGVINNFYIVVVPFFIFLCWWMLFKMKGEQEATALYGNLVVTAGMDIDSQMNGYSQRPFSKESVEIKNMLNKNFKNKVDNFGKTMGKELIFMDWKINENDAIFYPVTAYLMIAQFYSIFLSLGKDKISWIKLNSEGKITVFVSKGDYDRILEEVTYHTLCRIIAERFERAFIESATGNKENAIKILRGEINA